MISSELVVSSLKFIQKCGKHGETQLDFPRFCFSGLDFHGAAGFTCRMCFTSQQPGADGCVSNASKHLGVSENVVYPIVPNGFADHYPY